MFGLLQNTKKISLGSILDSKQSNYYYYIFFSVDNFSYRNKAPIFTDCYWFPVSRWTQMALYLKNSMIVLIETTCQLKNTEKTSKFSTFKKIDIFEFYQNVCIRNTNLKFSTSILKFWKSLKRIIYFSNKIL